MKKIIIEKEWNRLDGKWSWVIAAGTFCCMVMTSGISMTVGIYHPVFLEAFHGGSGNTAIVSALNFGMMSFIGKISLYFRLTSMHIYTVMHEHTHVRACMYMHTYIHVCMYT